MDRKLYVKKPKISIRNQDKTEKVELGKRTSFMDIKLAKKYGKITKMIDENNNETKQNSKEENRYTSEITEENER